MSKSIFLKSFFPLKDGAWKIEFLAYTYVISWKRSASEQNQLHNNEFLVKTGQSANNQLNPAKKKKLALNAIYALFAWKPSIINLIVASSWSDYQNVQSLCFLEGLFCQEFILVVCFYWVLVDLLAFYHLCCCLIGYGAHYLFCDKSNSVYLLTEWQPLLCIFNVSEEYL